MNQAMYIDEIQCTHKPYKLFLMKSIHKTEQMYTWKFQMVKLKPKLF